MRLLQIDEYGEFSLTDDLLHNIPPYAILSHTWGEDHEEVTFRDLTKGPRGTKAGYRKLRFCAQQAERDGLHYFWVDTCCINKENHSELSEAIASMYRWYEEAMKCYVYLSDLSIVDDNHAAPSLQLWEPEFRKSRWFTRGWTLQELLAPTSVEFFCSKGTRLGDKKSLEPLLHEITKIPVQALQGASLAEFSVEERMSWAEMRQTKRGEDKSYSLLGLFDVSMPLIYGEGEEKAFRRLQKEIHGDYSALELLPYAVEAPFNSFAKQHESICLADTRTDLLHEIYDWADGQDKPCIFWLNGLAGTGKSTIARTVARRYEKQRRLAASFFFSKGGGDVGHAGLFVTSIAVQLAQNVPASRPHIRDAVEARRNIASQSLDDQWHHLVLGPLSKLRQSSLYILFVDALDECDNENDIRLIVQLLAESRSLEGVRLRIFLTSRPEVPIRFGFTQLQGAEHQDFVLQNVSPSIVDHDIQLFLEHNLGLIGREDGQEASWPGAEVIQALVRSASGLFIWAATACRFIREGLFAEERVRTLVEGSDFDNPARPEEHLNRIYLAVLQSSTRLSYNEGELRKHHTIMRQILGSIVALQSLLSTECLSVLLLLPKQRLDRMLKDLHAILHVPKAQGEPLRLHHPSFRDFIFDKNRCSDTNFWVDKKQANEGLAYNCIQLMSSLLKQDICGFDDPGTFIADAQKDRLDQYLSPELQYACIYWVDHFAKSGVQLRDDDQVHRFLQKHLLHWLEVLGWIGKVSEGVSAIRTLESFATPDMCPILSLFIHDAIRFTLSNRSAIAQTPLQTYYSALAFAPTTSIIKEQFANCTSRWIRKLPKVDAEWTAVVQTLEGHVNCVKSAVFSRDGKILASASDDKMIKLWDAKSGAVLKTLRGHSNGVHAVAFSPDGKTLASASYDTTVKLWDPWSGKVLRTLEDHPSRLYGVAWSPDGKTLASASGDKTVKLWDAQSGAVLHTFKDHSECVAAVAFSPNGKTLASASDDRTVKLWDVKSGAVLQTLKGHSGNVNAVTFSPDGNTLVSGSYDRSIKIWDSRSGSVLQTLEGHFQDAKAVAFSPDGKTLASALTNETVNLWDMHSGAVLQTLRGGSQGHSGTIQSVAFSPDGKTLASASNDMTVKLWDAQSSTVLQTTKDHLSYVYAVAFSPDGKALASGSRDKTVKLWDPQLGAVLQTLEGHLGWVYAISFSPSGKKLASASTDQTVKLWDAQSSAILQTLKGHLDSVKAVAWSPDGKTLASASDDKTVKLWDAQSGAVLQTLEAHSGSVIAVAFSPSGRALASASMDETVKLWDALSGTVLQTFKSHINWIKTIAFSPDGKTLALASVDRIVKLWDARSGEVLQTLHGDLHDTRLFSFANDGNSFQTDWLSLLFEASLIEFERQPQFQPPVFLKNQWVCYGNKPILRLPPGHRPRRFAIYRGMVAFGYASGRVTTVEICL